MVRRCYYEVLSVERTATHEEIKRSYRKLAMQYHPDRNPGDAESESKFKEAAEAYDILRDPDKRSRYDRFGHDGVNGQGGFRNNEDIFSHFGDIFSDLFGFSMGGAARGGKNRPRQGADLRYNLGISFKQASKGADIPIKIPRNAVCPECKGKKTTPGTSTEVCRQCNGAGQVRHSQGFFQISVPCPTCQGTGEIIPDPCTHCRGEGLVHETRELSIHIPAGVDTGNRLRVRGEGEGGVNGGPNGDLYVVIHVENDDTFTRDGQNLFISREITFVQAALGDKIEVPTLDESISMDIPKGTQSGELFRISGKGLPFPGRNASGDLLVEVKVLTPTKLNSRQEELLREFAEVESKKTITKAKKIIKKVGKAMGIDK
ncbi:molecular chaperone DnaJ [Desulfovibrio sp. OttesenSCG-928-G15]|nr:molecular chaperone DnaJ [Desulfovibrio sp. OttesenSCG-928-G15]